MSNFVIKNCPLLQQICAFNVCGNAYGTKYLCGEGRYECQDRTDCLLKRIYENVKQCQCKLLNGYFDIEYCEK